MLAHCAAHLVLGSRVIWLQPNRKGIAMRITILVDVNTIIDQYYIGEPAVCYYIEDGVQRVLLDTGYSDVFMRNAKSLNIDLNAVTDVAISHGHNDHTGGLRYFAGTFSSQTINLIAHPDAFQERSDNGLSIGCPVELSKLEECFNLKLTKKPYAISDHLLFLGEIPSFNDFERTAPVGLIKENGISKDDFILDDSALAYTGTQGLFIITGCSHSGICNIIEYAKRVSGEQRIAGVLGGFHIIDVSEQLTKTIDYFAANGISTLYPCHCVSFAAKAEIHKKIPIYEVGVGLRITVE